MFAKELLNKPNGFISVLVSDKEYGIEGIQRIKTCANIDDSITHWVINLSNERGNVIR